MHALLVTLLSGVMRWDIRHPEKRFGDRFVLVGGHTIPLIYTTLAVLNEALRVKYAQTKDKRYLVPKADERALVWEDLLRFRHRGGLSGHAEMEGKTLFLKFNTGPSGHGGPAAAGLALALKRAGAEGVKVFGFEGEAGLTPGAAHETMNSAWGLALDNLYFVIDWNDYGIDDHPVSTVVHGTPTDWFAPHGWRVFGAEFGSEWGPVTQAMVSMVYGDNPTHAPSMAWMQHAQGPRLPQVRQPVARRAAQDEQRDLLGVEEAVRRDVRRPVRQLRRRRRRRTRRGSRRSSRPTCGR